MKPLFHTCYDCHQPDPTADRRPEFGGARVCATCAVDRHATVRAILAAEQAEEPLVRYSPRAAAALARA